jgi:cellulose synthase/poly-beta-1,6-N-acetylglucosamine synthase-like glycosyltransferase
VILFEILYAICAFWLGIYGLNNLFLLGHFLSRRRPKSDSPPLPSPPAVWPAVTVQLPVYNELHMVERLLDAVGGLDYPRDRLEIQVLDDSNDETRDLIAAEVARLRARGVDATHLTREDRGDFKAGALARGLDSASGELLAMFDADFAPKSDWLRRVIPRFADERVGCVQTRWGHVNRDYSFLTQLEALGMDGHFVVEQAARDGAGLFLNFNGTAGIWRRECIADAGGWTGDTLTEDLDLSYRAQMRGWRIVYLPEVVVPSELPAQISAFKRQQARWAQGSIQTALKLLGPLLRTRLSLRAKVLGAIHLTGYAVHPLMLLMLILAIPMSLSESSVLRIAPWLVIPAAGPPLLYAISQWADGGDWLRRLRALPGLVALGTGLSLSNSIAVAKALLGVRQGFQRTPKYALRQADDRWVSSHYALGGDPLIWGELALALLALALLALPRVGWGFAPWLVIYAAGFAYVGILGLVQARELRRWSATQPKPDQDKPGHTRSSEPPRTLAD